ncbi:MAG: tetratricopeptide repeat protein [Chloroflexi bacterium]|nr:tetratricopeptide repeat protein [Chloroflexota bacterium]
MMSKVPLSDLSERLQDLLAQRHYEAGFALGRHILRYFPRHLTTYAQLGPAALEAGLAADAMDILTRALSANPESADLWAAFAKAAQAIGDETQARRASLIASELRADADAAGAGEMAQAVQAAARGDWSEALRHCHHVFEADPTRMDAALGAGTALFHLGQYQACQMVANRALRELPFALKAHLLLALCAWQEKDADACERHLKQARPLDPEDIYLRQWFELPPDFPPARPATLPPWDETQRWPR